MTVFPRITSLPTLSSVVREGAWDRFLAEYASLILQIVRLFERDPDRVHDNFVFVCEELKRDDLRRLRSFDERGSAAFTTWLRAVVRNLCLDWRRKRFGRPRLYRSIARLPALEREIFRSIHMRGLQESETFHAVKMLYPSLTPDQFGDCLVRLRKALSSHQSWLLATSAVRLVSLSSSRRHPAVPEKDREIAAVGHDPEENVSRREYLSSLRRALGHLPKQQRLLVRLRFEQELTLEQIARVTGLGNPRKVQGLLHKAIASMREEMTADVSAPVSVKDS